MNLETLIALLGGGAAVLITLLGVGIAVCSVVVVIAACGGGLGALAWWTKKSGEESKALNQAAQMWPSTTGVIRKSRVENQGYDYVNNVPVIEFAYQVSGVEYTSGEIFAGGLYLRYTLRGSEENPYDLVERYPVGMQVPVFYNPTDPTKAALER